VSAKGWWQEALSTVWDKMPGRKARH